MSTSNALCLYQIETFGSETRRGYGNEAGQSRHGVRRGLGQRSGPFLVHLMVDGDAGLRRVLGRSDVASRRETAYGSALANRPSVQPLRFLHRLADA